MRSDFPRLDTPTSGHGLPDRPRPEAPVVYDLALFAEFNAGTTRARLAAQRRDRRAEAEGR